MRGNRVMRRGSVVVALLAALTTVIAPGYADADDADLVAPPVDGDPTSAVMIDPGGGNPVCGVHPATPVEHLNSPTNPGPTYWSGRAVASCQSPIAYIQLTAQVAFYCVDCNGQRVGDADTGADTIYVKAEGKWVAGGATGTVRTWANATFYYDHIVGPSASLGKGCRRVNDYTVSCAAASGPNSVGPHLEG